MRTTIDLPDELLRKAKVTAAVNGVSLKDLLRQFVEAGLAKELPRFGHSEPIPVMLEGASGIPKLMSNEELLLWLDSKDAEEGA